MANNTEHEGEQSDERGGLLNAEGILHILDSSSSTITTERENTTSSSPESDTEKIVKRAIHEHSLAVSKTLNDYNKILDGLKEYTTKEIKKIQGQGKTTKEELDEQVQSTKNYADEVKKELEDKIENSKLTIIETLGIFIALFTFISIDLQVFKSYRNPKAISGLLLIFFGAIFLFIIIFDFFILQARRIKSNDQKSNVKIGFTKKCLNHLHRIILSLASISFTVVGVWLFIGSPIDDFQDIKLEIKKEISSQYSELLKMNENNQKSIENLKTNLDNIKNCIKDFGFTSRCFK